MGASPTSRKLYCINYVALNRVDDGKIYSVKECHSLYFADSI
jgi:hypothetical protein